MDYKNTYESNIKEYTVTELSNALKKTLEVNFDIIHLKGEVSGLTTAASGHVYLSLKDKITIGKKDTLANTKRLVSKLQNTQAVNKIKKTLSKRYESRNGGYTRIVKVGFRYGDNAPMAVIEFVDRDKEAKRVDKKKKDTTKENKEEKKIASA